MARARCLMLALPLLLAGCLRGPESLAEADDTPPDAGRVISVLGRGSFLAPPTRVELEAVVPVDAPAADAAWQQGAERLFKLTQKLEAAGVAPADMVSVGADLRRTDAGFRLEQRLRVTVHDVKTVPVVLANALSGGAQRIEGLCYSLDDDRAAGDRARERALLDAREKAQLLAQELQVRLGPVRGVSELEDVSPAAPGAPGSAPAALERVCTLRVTYLLLD